jgi:hypothetical protein
VPWAAASSAASVSATVIGSFGPLVHEACSSIALRSTLPLAGTCDVALFVAATRSRSLLLDAPKGFESCRRSFENHLVI